MNELVDSANKEARIENNLAKIKSIWDVQALSFKEYKGCYVIGSLDETVEFMDNHSMQLMGMISQKDVEEFKEIVLEWQRKLKTVDTVLGIWIKVQKIGRDSRPFSWHLKTSRLSYLKTPNDSRKSTLNGENS